MTLDQLKVLCTIIDTGSFSEKDIVAKMTFDDRPSTINRQKRLFAEQVQTFVDDSRSSQYTDITGGLLQAVEFLNEKQPAVKTVLIFSDLKEDLKDGYIRDISFELDGFNVIALNVTMDVRKVSRTRSGLPAPTFCPATGAVANAIAMAGRKTACMTREPTPKPAWASGPKPWMVQ